jgi:hypothetical protein
MRLWRSKRDDGGARPDPVTEAAALAELSDDPDDQRQIEQKQRLERALYDLADAIGAKDETDRFWSAKVRTSADQVRAGQVHGLRNFLSLFGGMGSINDQAFSGVLGADLSGAHALASGLLGRIEYDSSNYGRRKVVLRPWTAGHAGKAVVDRKGTVFATRDDSPGTPSIIDIENSCPINGNVAVMSIAPDGSCDVYRRSLLSSRKERWLAAKLKEHNPALHLGPPQA